MSSTLEEHAGRRGARGAAPAVDTDDQYIQVQIERTARQVKLNELASGLLTLLIAMVVFVLVIVFIDHWVVGLPSSVRALLLVCAAISAVAYLAIRLMPMLTQEINPAYAAKVIEQSEPTLKNSVLNFMLLRSTPHRLHASVYDAVRQRAAADLSRVPMEHVVDWSHLLRLGYGLAALLAIFAAYIILSPKNTFQTIGRLAAPWADIARPSVVQIHNVQPGDTRVFMGQRVEISATIDSLDDVSDARIVYSTADQQVTDCTANLARSSAKESTWQISLPVDDPAGLQQSYSYRIEAGDAVSRTYHLNVVPAPTIVVQSVDLTYPKYTRIPAETLTHQGDIRALEGTHVTLHAFANQPIDAAWIEWEPDQAKTNDSDAQRNDETAVEMKYEGQQATASFVLERAADGSRAKHRSYQLRFRTTDQFVNEQPVLHRIEVIPDLPPEIEILEPLQLHVEVPEDGQQAFELRAIDPDFGLSHIRVHVAHRGNRIVTESLFSDPKGVDGQMVVDYSFVPRKLGLKAGDRVMLWGEAEDNRGDGQRPSRRKTANVQITISPNLSGDSSNSRNRPSDEPANDDKHGGDAARNEDGTGEKQDGSAAKDGGEPGDNSGRENSGSDSDNSQGSEGDNSSDSQAESGDSDGGDSDSGSEAGGAGGSGSESGSDSGSETGGSGGQPSDTEGSSGSSSESQSGGSGKGQPSDSSSGEGNSQSGGEPTGRPSSSASGGQDNHERTEPLHDGEAFERALEYMKEQQARGGEASKDSQAGESQSGNSQSGNSQSGNSQSGNSPSGNEQSQGDDASSGQQSQSDPNSGDPSSGESASDGQSGEEGSSSDGAQQSGDATSDSESGSRGDPNNQSGGSKSGSQPEQDSQGNSPSGSGGQSGQGNQSDDSQDGSGSQGQNRDRQKQGSSENSGSGESESQSPSNSQRQSSSGGGKEGDKSGGGKRGGGQNADQPGNDSAGNNSPADEGNGAAQERGNGETGGGGAQQMSDTPTGNSGSERGNGSGSREAAGGNQPDGSSKRDPNGRPPQGSENTPSSAGEQNGQSAKGNGRPNNSASPDARAGGQPSDGTGNDGPPPAQLPPDAEKANEQYAREKTDLVLDYLKDQQDTPDPELLDRLQWTQDDLKGFLNRWQKMKQDAGADKSKQHELSESLRSLGLRPGASEGRRATPTTDRLRDLQHSGPVSRPPSAFAELLDAFKKGTARATPNE